VFDTTHPGIKRSLDGGYWAQVPTRDMLAVIISYAPPRKLTIAMMRWRSIDRTHPASIDRERRRHQRRSGPPAGRTGWPPSRTPPGAVARPSTLRRRGIAYTDDSGATSLLKVHK
jgi:hypothetical protein